MQLLKSEFEMGKGTRVIAEQDLLKRISELKLINDIDKAELKRLVLLLIKRREQ